MNTKIDRLNPDCYKQKNPSYESSSRIRKPGLQAARWRAAQRGKRDAQAARQKNGKWKEGCSSSTSEKFEDCAKC